MQYRVCLNKTTGKLIEMQSGGTTPEHLDTLRQNAINSGKAPAEIEVKYVTEAEWAAIEAANRPVPTRDQLLRAEFSKQGIDDHKILMALFKKVMKGDSTDADSILATISDIEKRI